MTRGRSIVIGREGEILGEDGETRRKRDGKKETRGERVNEEDMS